MINVVSIWYYEIDSLMRVGIKGVSFQFYVLNFVKNYLWNEKFAMILKKWNHFCQNSIWYLFFEMYLLFLYDERL